jgi:hypothetical protein
MGVAKRGYDMCTTSTSYNPGDVTKKEGRGEGEVFAHLHDLRVACAPGADSLIAGVLHLALGVAHAGRHHPRYPLECQLHAQQSCLKEREDHSGREGRRDGGREGRGSEKRGDQTGGRRNGQVGGRGRGGMRARGKRR